MQRTTRFLVTLAAVAAATLAQTGCQSSYVNSPMASAMREKKKAEFSHALIARAYNAKPAIRFPATIGIAPQDQSSQFQLRALDANGKLDSLGKLPQVRGVVNVSSLVLADSNSQIAGANGQSVAVWNKSDVILREAAARLHADAVLLLKVENTVTDGKLFSPLSLFTLGMFPNDRSEVIATALAALVDTRTGYVYATLERSAGKTCLTHTWDDSTRDKTVMLASRKAMEKLLGEFPAVWGAVVAKHRK